MHPLWQQCLSGRDKPQCEEPRADGVSGCVRGPRRARERRRGGKGGGARRGDRPREGGGRKSARSSGPRRSCCRCRSCPGKIAKTAMNKQLTLGRSAPPVMGVRLLWLVGLLRGGGGTTTDRHTCMHACTPSQEGASVRSRGPGTWQCVGRCRTQERGSHPRRMRTRAQETQDNAQLLKAALSISKEMGLGG
jgi:hypothetical protein